MTANFAENPRAWAEGVIAEACGSLFPFEQQRDLVVPLLYMVRRGEELQATPESDTENEQSNVAILEAGYIHTLLAKGWSSGQLQWLTEFARRRILEEQE